MSLTTQLVRIHDLFERWRSMGSLLLPDGSELIGRCGDDDSSWMHAVFPGLQPSAIDQLEHALGRPLPSPLRAMYRYIGGLTLFGGAFQVYGPGTGTGIVADRALAAGDLVTLDHEIDALGWLPAAAMPFATNSWDLSVHVAGMSPVEKEILRCDRATGTVLERHRNVWACLAHRLYRLDRLLVT